MTTITKKTMLLAGAQPPVITTIKDSVTGYTDSILKGNPAEIEGTNLGGADDPITLGWTDAEGVPQTKTIAAADVTSRTPTKIALAASFWNGVSFGTEMTMTFRVTTAGGTAEKSTQGAK